VLAIVLSVIRAVTCRRRAKFCTSVAQVSRGSAIILQTCPAAKFSDWTIHYWGSFRLWFMIFLKSHLTARAWGKLPPSFLLLCLFSSVRSSRASRETFRIASVCGHGNASASLNVRFHYYVTTNHSCDKSTRFGKSASIMYAERTILST